MSKSIPAKIKKLIFQEASSRCVICGNDDINVLQIHHIVDKAKDGGCEPENLILVCSNCHSKITAGGITEDDVKQAKTNLLNSRSKTRTNGFSSNVVSISGGQHSGIIANVVYVKTNRKTSQRFNYPKGSIGSDVLARIYSKYLIDRYNEFKSADKHVSNFSYAVIYRSIQTQFKGKWDQLPLTRFNELVEFLQNKIDGTILGRVRKSRGQPNYESLEEYKTTMKMQ